MLLCKFIAKDGSEIVIRTFLRKDTNRVKEFCNFINSIVEERDYILYDKKISPKEEKEWLKKKWEDVKKGNCVYVIAEHNGKLIGASEVKRMKGVMKHVGKFGIGPRGT